MRKKPEYPKPVVHGKGDNTLGRHALAIISRLRAIARHKPAAIEIYQHRQLRTRMLTRRHPHIQIQTILTHPVRTKHHIRIDRRLHRPRSAMIGLTHTLPADDGLRLPPSQLPHRRRSIRYALKAADTTAFQHPLYSTMDCYDLRSRRCRLG